MHRQVPYLFAAHCLIFIRVQILIVILSSQLSESFPDVLGAPSLPTSSAVGSYCVLPGLTVEDVNDLYTTVLRVESCHHLPIFNVMYIAERSQDAILVHSKGKGQLPEPAGSPHEAPSMI
jgi:hypothetical protein